MEADNRQAAIGVENNWRFLPASMIDHSLLKLALRLDDVLFDNQLDQHKNTYASPKIGLLVGNDSDWFRSHKQSGLHSGNGVISIRGQMTSMT